MIPLALVTGFLGSGKTSLLRHVAARQRDRRLVFLVNEFAGIDIDGRLLDLPPDRLVAVPGGSIFCRCLVSDFIRHLRAIAARPGVAGVVVEASGVADPRVVARMLAETTLDRAYRLAALVTLVDPGSFDDLLETLPSIRTQVEAASLILINKTDLFDAAQLAATEARARALNPHAALVHAVHGRVDADLLGAAAAPPGPAGEYAPCADPNYGRMTLTPADTIDLAGLRAALAGLGPDLYRLKGFVRATDGRVRYVDAARARVQTAPAPPDARPALVCIFRPAALARVRAALRPFEAGPPP